MLGGPSGTPEAPIEATPAGRDGGATAPAPKATRPPGLYTEYPDIDPADPRAVVGFANYVFVGTAVVQVGSEPLRSSDPNDAGIPHEQFRVDVGRVLKAEGPEPLRKGDTVVVNHRGGVDPENGREVVVIVDDPDPADAETTGGGVDPALVDRLLEEGETYLFSTVYDPDRRWHVVAVQPLGNVPLESGEQSAAVVELYERAVADPIPPDETRSES